MRLPTVLRSPRAPLAIVGLLCLAISAEASQIQKAGLKFNLSVLSPEVRASLQDIDVLVLTEKNLELVWKLSEQPDLADVVVVTCSPSCHSSDVLEALADWARDGRGSFIGPSAQFRPVDSCCRTTSSSSRPTSSYQPASPGWRPTVP